MRAFIIVCFSICAMFSCKKEEVEQSCLSSAIGQYSFKNGPYDTLVNTSSQTLIVQKQVTPDFDAVNDRWIIQSTGYDKIYLTITACGVNDIIDNEETTVWSAEFDDPEGIYNYKIVASQSGGASETFEGDIDLMNAEKD